LRAEVGPDRFRRAGLVEESNSPAIDWALMLPFSSENQSGSSAAVSAAWPRASAVVSSAVSSLSSRGLRSISSSTNRSSSICVSCSSRIDCISCGVITRDCDWRSCSLAASDMTGYLNAPETHLRCRYPGADYSAGMKLARLLLVKRFAVRSDLPERYLARIPLRAAIRPQESAISGIRA
jgi:hypothetical protein